MSLEIRKTRRHSTTHSRPRIRRNKIIPSLERLPDLTTFRRLTVMDHLTCLLPTWEELEKSRRTKTSSHKLSGSKGLTLTKTTSLGKESLHLCFVEE